MALIAQWQTGIAVNVLLGKCLPSALDCDPLLSLPANRIVRA
jgi:hypothetical protein